MITAENNSFRSTPNIFPPDFYSIDPTQMWLSQQPLHTTAINNAEAQAANKSVEARIREQNTVGYLLENFFRVSNPNLLGIQFSESGVVAGIRPTAQYVDYHYMVVAGAYADLCGDAMNLVRAQTIFDLPFDVQVAYTNAGLSALELLESQGAALGDAASVNVLGEHVFTRVYTAKQPVAKSVALPHAHIKRISPDSLELVPRTEHSGTRENRSISFLLNHKIFKNMYELAFTDLEQLSALTGVSIQTQLRTDNPPYGYQCTLPRGLHPEQYAQFARIHYEWYSKMTQHLLETVRESEYSFFLRRYKMPLGSYRSLWLINPDNPAEYLFTVSPAIQYNAGIMELMDIPLHRNGRQMSEIELKKQSLWFAMLKENPELFTRLSLNMMFMGDQSD